MGEDSRSQNESCRTFHSSIHLGCESLCCDCTAPDGEDNSVRFRDVLDKEHWEEYVVSRNQAPLISWDYFIKNAPRKLILVEKDIGCGRCMDCDDSSKDFLKHSIISILQRQFVFHEI